MLCAYFGYDWPIFCVYNVIVFWCISISMHMYAHHHTTNHPSRHPNPPTNSTTKPSPQTNPNPKTQGRRDGMALVRNGAAGGKVESYRVLEILEFTSARKRMRWERQFFNVFAAGFFLMWVVLCMYFIRTDPPTRIHNGPPKQTHNHSVIVEAEDGQILVLAKGADTAMIPRLKPGQARRSYVHAIYMYMLFSFCLCYYIFHACVGVCRCMTGRCPGMCVLCVCAHNTHTRAATRPA